MRRRLIDLSTVNAFRDDVQPLVGGIDEQRLRVTRAVGEPEVVSRPRHALLTQPRRLGDAIDPHRWPGGTVVAQVTDPQQRLAVAVLAWRECLPVTCTSAS